MKKLLLPFILFFLINKSQAQIVFCPPGAEWNYYFSDGPSGGLENESVKYMRDTIIGSDTIKILQSSRLYIDANPIPPYFLTHIKQKGDTIFFNNFSTQYTWQILYNFASQVNQGWNIAHRGCHSNSLTSSYNVVSIGSIVENSLTLKQLNMGVFTITERFGSSGFLFMLSNKGNCHRDYFAGSLCYRDNSFGLKQFSSYPCNYSNTVGLEENELKNGLKIYPNPTNGFVRIKIDDSQNKKLLVKIIDLSGRLIEEHFFETTNNLEINTSAFKAGVYFVSLFYEGGAVETKKLVVY